MNARPSRLARWKERGLFAAVAAALAAYAGTWGLELWTDVRRAPGPAADKQTYIRASKPEPLPAGGAEVFPSADASDVYDPTLRPILVGPREGPKREVIKPVKLSLPPAAVPAPPMLLPVPGPALEFAGELPRWPEGPPAPVGSSRAGGTDAPAVEAPVLPTETTGVIAPVEFEARPYATVILDTHDTLEGEIISPPDAPMVKVRTFDGRGDLAVARKRVKLIKRPRTIEQAHDDIARKIIPGDHEKWYGLALGCLRKRPALLKRAVADLERATAAQPRHLASLILLGRVFLRLNDIKKARSAVEKARSITGSNDEVHILLGKILAASGGDPRKEFEKALALKVSVEAAVALARAELVRGNYSSAEKAVKTAETLAPDSLEVHAVCGDVLLARGNLEEAEVAYKRAIAAGAKRRGAEGHPGRAGVAAVQYLQGRLDEADEVLRMADVSDPQISYLQGLVRLARGGESLKKAKECFLAAAQAGRARGYLGLGTYLYHDLGGDMAAALSEFRKAAAAGPNDPHAAELAGWCQYRLGLLDGATRSYARLARLVPRHAAGHAAAGAVILARGSHADAARAYREGLAACPGSGRLLAGLGLAQIAAGELDAATQSFAAALSGGFRGPDVYLGLGYVANARKDFDAASRSLISAVASAQDARSSTAQAYAREALVNVEAGRGLRLSAFFFDTPGGVQEPLRSHARFGVTPSSQGGSLVLSGTQAKQDDGRTLVQAAVDGGFLSSFAADVELEASSPVNAGVFMESRNGAVEIAHTRLGRASWRAKDGRDAPWGAWQNFAAWSTSGGRMRLEIGVTKTKLNLARIRLRGWNVPPGPEGVLASRTVEFKHAFWRERAFSAGVFVSARNDVEVRARFDNLVISERGEGTGP